MLKPGGVLRISTPDLATLITDYKSARIDRYAGTWEPPSPCIMVNEGMRLWGHQFLYDEAEMIASLKVSGFGSNDIYRVSHRKSDYSVLRDLEVRPYRCDLILEATKPPLAFRTPHARVPS
jgi:predicted SAM-dependent methyltransferase